MAPAPTRPRGSRARVLTRRLAHRARAVAAAILSSRATFYRFASGHFARAFRPSEAPVERRRPSSERPPATTPKPRARRTRRRLFDPCVCSDLLSSVRQPLRPENPVSLALVAGVAHPPRRPRREDRPPRLRRRRVRRPRQKNSPETPRERSGDRSPVRQSSPIPGTVPGTVPGMIPVPTGGRGDANPRARRERVHAPSPVGERRPHVRLVRRRDGERPLCRRR